MDEYSSKVQEPGSCEIPVACRIGRLPRRRLRARPRDFRLMSSRNASCPGSARCPDGRARRSGSAGLRMSFAADTRGQLGRTGRPSRETSTTQRERSDGASRGRRSACRLRVGLLEAGSPVSMDAELPIPGGCTASWPGGVLAGGGGATGVAASLAGGRACRGRQLMVAPAHWSSRSRPPSLGRSLRSRRTRSPSPNPDMASARHGWPLRIRGRPGIRRRAGPR